MGNALSRLSQVRSRRADLLLAYLRHCEEALARNPLLDRFGRSLDALRIPLRVVSHEPIRDVEELTAREHFRFEGLLQEEREKSEKRIYAFRGSMEESRAESRSQQPELLDQLQPYLRMAVLLGDPGSGKTEWLKLQARRAAQKAREQIERFDMGSDALCIPIYGRLDLLNETLADTDSADAIARLYLGREREPTEAHRFGAALLALAFQHGWLSQELGHWLWQRLWERPSGHAGSILVCLDAWDEVRHAHDRLATALRAFAGETTARVLLTSRIIGYSHELLPDGVGHEAFRREMRICPFEWAETEQFIQGFLSGPEADIGKSMAEELRNKQAVAGMAQNPLLATLLCLAYAPDQGKAPLSFPLRRVEVYGQVLDGLLGLWPRSDGTRVRLPASPALIPAKRRLLCALARRFFPDELITADALDEWWSGDGGHLRTIDPDDPIRGWLRQHDGNLAEALCHDAVLVRCGDGYAFVHLTFQEYLVACSLAQEMDRAAALIPQRQTRSKSKAARQWDAAMTFVSRKAWLPEWREVISLMVGRLADPVPVMTMLGDPEPNQWNPHGDDVFRHRLAVGCACVAELDIKLLDGNVKLCSRLIGEAADIWFQHAIRSEWCEYPFDLYDQWEEKLLHGPETPVNHLALIFSRLDLNRLLWGEECFITVLSRKLSDVDRRAKMVAAWLLIVAGVRIGDKNLHSILVSMLHHGLEFSIFDEDFYIKCLAAKALNRIGSTQISNQVIFGLIGQLRHQKSPRSDHLIIDYPFSYDEGAYFSYAKTMAWLLGELATTTADSAYVSNKIAEAFLKHAWYPDGLLEALRRNGFSGIPKDRQLRVLFKLLDSFNPNTLEYFEYISWLIRHIHEPKVINDYMARFAEDLTKTDPRAISHAADMIGLLGPLVQSNCFHHMLAEHLNNKADYVRYTVLKAIQRLGLSAATPDVIEAVIKLSATDKENRRSIFHTLLSFGKTSLINPSIIYDILTSPDRDTETPTSYITSLIVPFLADERVEYLFDHLLTLVSNPASENAVHFSETRVKTRISKRNPYITSALKLCLLSHREYVRIAAINNLQQLVDSGVIQSLINDLQDSDSDVRYRAARTLARLGKLPIKATVLAALKRRFEIISRKSGISDGSDRLFLAVTLANNCQADFTSKVVDVLAERAYSTVFSAAVKCLVPELNDVVLEQLISRLENNYDYYSFRALGELGPKAATPNAIQALMDGLTGSTWEIEGSVHTLSQWSKPGIRFFQNNNVRWIANSAQSLAEDLA
jgi:hypothetical protein